MLDRARRRGLGGPQLRVSLPIDRPRGRAPYRRRELLGQRRQCGLEDRGVHGEHEPPESAGALWPDPAQRSRRGHRGRGRGGSLLRLETSATRPVRPRPP